MIWLAALCAFGIPVGFLLIGRVPICRAQSFPREEPVSVIIPARNEEHTLPVLLRSLGASGVRATEIVVVDDSSTDATAEVARLNGATVLTAPSLPSGWTGKTWACTQGAASASNDPLLFLDADTYLESRGLERMLAAHEALGRRSVALSVLPYHVTKKVYEELSFFFHLMMAAGAGGFGPLGKPRLFGQAMLIGRSLYESSGGHRAVRGAILENFSLASRIDSVGGRCVTFAGRGVINVRMFPNGFGQLCEGWVKAFADGAAACDPLVLAASIFWLSALCTTFVVLVAAGSDMRLTFGLLYLCFAVQLLTMARQLGSYSLLTCVLYPVPLFFYFGLFGRSFYLRALKRSVQWRGRTV